MKSVHVVAAMRRSVVGLPWLIPFVFLALSHTAPATETGNRMQRAAAFATVNGFVENRGQWPVEVLYFARLGQIDLTVLADAFVLRPQPDFETERWCGPVVFRLPKRCDVSAHDAMPTRHHFLVGERCARDARGFDQLVYEEVVPGIDLVLRSEGAQFAYDLQLAPGARLEDFTITLEGAHSPTQLSAGSLHFETDAGPFVQTIGASWQTDATGTGVEPIESRFVLLPADSASSGTYRLGFEAPDRDRSRSFVLDPTLVFSTFVGGSGQELLKKIDADASGATYLTCRSVGTTPTTPNAVQASAPDPLNAWIGKISPDGKVLEFGTYLGGSDLEEPFGIQIDHDGSIVVAGSTWSSNFPTTPGAFQTTFASAANQSSDLFLSRLAPDGGSLLWSTYYGKSNYETATAMALFPNGDVLVAGENYTATPASTAGAFDTHFDPHDQVLIRFSKDGKKRLYQTYFQCSYIADVEIDNAENIYFAGNVQIQYNLLPATPGAFKTSLAPGDIGDGFVAKMRGDGSSLVWATYLGGSTNIETVWGLEVDVAGAVYVVGQVTSSDFPTTLGAFDTTNPSISDDGFATKILPAGTNLAWSTFFGACCGQGAGYLSDVAIDGAGNVIAVGNSNNPILPITFDAFQPTPVGIFPNGDAHLTRFDALGESLLYSTWFGGAGSDYSVKVSLDEGGMTHLVCTTGSSGFPTTPGSYDVVYSGGSDIGVAAFSLGQSPWNILPGGLKGSVDSPVLAGVGPLITGSLAHVAIRGSLASSMGFLIIGAQQVNLPVLGGVFVPSPDLVIPAATNGLGRIDITTQWPLVPVDTKLYLQCWITDPNSPTGWSATNGLKIDAQ